MRKPRPHEYVTTMIAVVVVVLAALFSTAFHVPSPPVPAHRVLPFPRESAFAGTRVDLLDRVPAEMPGEAPTPTVSATATLSPAERHLLKLRALHLAPPLYLLDQSIRRVPGAGRRVVLTFDDGPSKNTTEVLSILRRYHAKATFFFVGGRCVGRPDTLRDVIAQGSEIGNHTWDHVSLLAQTKAYDEAEIRRAEQLYFDYAGVRPVWVRPQSGWADQTGIDAMTALGKRFVFWNDFGMDTVKTFSAATIARYAIDQARDGSIILLHETNPRTVQALPRILSGLEARGFEVTTLTDAMRASGALRS